MAELRRLYEGRVQAEEIDHLGHMNVRFYLEKALHATGILASELGLAPAACAERGAVLETRDTFTRHYREQLEGAPLAVMGGVLAVDGGGLRVYHELVNTDREELAACFVQALQLRERTTRRRLPLPEMVAQAAGDGFVSLPEHGRPRTLELDRTPPALTLAVAQERGLAIREERVVRAEECDDECFFRASRYQELVWGGSPAPARGAVPVFETESGGRFGWATLESRGILLELPRVGARVQSFGAEVALGRKTSYRHHWVFDLESGRLLCISSMVNLAFDIGARRSIEIPPLIRATIETQHHPDLE